MILRCTELGKKKYYKKLNIWRKKMISRKYERLVFAFVMSFIMSCIMSLVITIINLGFIDGLILKWLEAWGKAFLFAFPVITIVGPMVRMIVHKLLVPEHTSH
jgi:hypothetical protein